MALLLLLELALLLLLLFDRNVLEPCWGAKKAVVVAAPSRNRERTSLRELMLLKRMWLLRCYRLMYGVLFVS
jgi:hypothetical protein